MTKDRFIALGLSAVAMATVIGGLYLGGSPNEARREKRDSLRSQQLSQISNLINDEYTRVKTVPTSTEAFLALTNDSQRWLPSPGAGFAVEPPEYRFIAVDSYELCATFETASNQYRGASIARPTGFAEETPDFWSYPAGRKCYTVKVPTWIKNPVAPYVPPPLPPPTSSGTLTP